MKKPIWITLIVLGAVFLSLLIWAICENKALELNTITVDAQGLPESFDGFRIAHVSDLHSTEIGKGNQKLISMLRAAKPDIIAITGDLMDCRDTDPSIAIAFCEEAAKIAPTYYVTGNHEARLEENLYNRLLDGLRSAGVTILEDEEQILTRNGESISVAGHKWGETDAINNISDFDGYTILLSHHPEDFDNYVTGGYELVLSGHAHGGQFRLPFVGGLYAPGQGVFPKYDSGLYTEGITNMIVSRGIGNSGFPLRFNNPPEVILVILKG